MVEAVLLEKSGLCKDEEQANQLVSSKIEEMTFILDDESMLILRRSICFLLAIKKEFLRYLEDSLSHDLLIFSTICIKTRGRSLFLLANTFADCVVPSY
jgi:hypothetical protein